MSFIIMKLPITSCPWLWPTESSNHPNSFHGGMFKLNAKFDVDSLLYCLIHFERNGPHSTHAHSTVSTAPTVSEVVIVHTCAHSSPLSLAARLYQCRTNHSSYSNNAWAFSRQTSYIYMGIYAHMCIYICVCIYVYI